MTVTEYYNEVNKKTRKNAIVEYLTKSYVPFKSNSNREERYSRVPRLSTRFLKHHECIFSNVTQLKGPKGNGGRANRDLNTPPTGGYRFKRYGRYRLTPITLKSVDRR